MKTIIACHNLRYSYHSTEVLHGIDFTIEHKGIVGLLGKNGAGKSTTINILMGFLQPDSGSCSVLGYPSHSIPSHERRRISLLHEGFVQYHFMTIEEIERFYAAFYPSWDRSIYYDLVDRLDVPRNRRISRLSCGQRSQVTLGLILAQRGELLILDDYSLGLDVGYRRLFLDFLRDYVDTYETTVLVTSHIMQELDSFLDRVIVLHKGTILANTSRDTFMQSFCCYNLPLPLLLEASQTQESCLSHLQDMKEIIRIEQGRNHVTVFSYADEPNMRSLLTTAGYAPTAPCHVVDMSFEDAFVGMTGLY
ncbi:MAG: ABC transporter ATP-binding protein [Deltaproteobacteria bacterium]|nr:MAG: ABC transporter ATP-binding protein [Deltaproteobacteria bacterium]